MSAENSRRGPSTIELEKPAPVAVCIFERPKTVDLVKKRVEGFEEGYVDAHLTKDSSKVIEAKRTATEGGKALPVPDPLGKWPLPRGVRGGGGGLPPGVYPPLR